MRIDEHGRVSDKPIVPPFTIVIDCRESLPYQFNRLLLPGRNNRLVCCKSLIGYLTAGDYSIVGMESMVAIERKSKADLFHSLGKGRERFEREMERLSMLDWAAVVVEAQFSSILSRPPKLSSMNPRAVESTIINWSVKYPTIHWFPCMSRRHAEGTTFRLLERFWKERKEDA